jgi:indolepyruvate ferredoxin oxidoreductase beta subunit
MKEPINFLLAGVGGQGTILASNVLVNIGLKAGFQVKQAEVHGMSQRGGSVTSHVRWGKVVYSPLIGSGEANVLLAFEKLEALRNLKAMHPGALVLINMQVIKPLTVISGDQEYPDDECLHTAFATLTPNLEFIQGEEIASSLGNLKAANVVLLGALSTLLERSGQSIPEITPDLWLKTIAERVPAKLADLNTRAFWAGRQAIIREK